MSESQNNPSFILVGDSKPHKLTQSRRDFLKSTAVLSGAIALTTTGYQIGRLGIDFDEALSNEPVPPRFPTRVESGDVNPEDQRLITLEKKMHTFQAVVDVLRDPLQHKRQKDYLRKRYNIPEAATHVLTRVLSKPEGTMSPDAIGTILRVSGRKNMNLPKDVTPLLDNAASMDLSPLFDYVIHHHSQAEWKKYITDNHLERPLAELQLHGDRALAEAGMVYGDFEFKKSLVDDPADAEKIGNNPGITIIDKGPHSVISIVSNRTQEVYQPLPELSEDAAKLSTFILRQIQTMYESGDEELAKMHVKEFTLFQTWILEKYRRFAVDLKFTNEEDFYKTQLFTQDKTSDTSTQRITQRLNRMVENVAQKLHQTHPQDDATTKALEYMQRASRGDVQAFNILYACLNPAGRSLFNSKAARNLEPHTPQHIFELAASSDDNEKPSGLITRESLLNATQAAAGYLFLMTSADYVHALGKTKDIELTQKDISKPELTQQLLSGEIDLMGFADRMFGDRKILIYNSWGEPKKSIISSRVCEPTAEVPQDLITILKATEGSPWNKGREYLQRFIYRNLRAIFSNNPNSGGSDPTMQIVKQLFPSQFDRGTIGAEYGGTEAVLHRPDKYDITYLKRLYDAILENKEVPELYELPKKNSKQKDVTKGVFAPISQICAKLENFILARDLRNKYGEEQLMDLYVRYVPLGNTRDGIQIHGFEAASQYYFDKSLDQLNRGEIAILVGIIQAPTAYSPQQWIDPAPTDKLIGHALIEKIFQSHAGELPKFTFYDEPAGPPVFIEGNVKEGGWIFDTSASKKRAFTVARLFMDSTLISQPALKHQIYDVKFTLKKPESWTSVDLADLATGTLFQQPISLGGGLATLREFEPEQLWYKTPDVFPLEYYITDRTQKAFDETFTSIFKDKQINLETREKSQVSDLLLSLWEIVTDQQAKEITDKYSPPEKTAYRRKALMDWCDSNGIMLVENSPLRTFIENFATANKWQCGQSALLINSILQTKFHIGYFPLSSIEGGVKRWGSVIKENFNVAHELGYTITNIDHVINTTKPHDQSNGVQTFDDLAVGDMLVSWRSMVAEDYADPGHVCTILDKGKDSLGRTYLKIMDSNFHQTGAARVQTVWSDSLGKYIYPGLRAHTVVIRADALKDHGRQVPANDEIFGKQIYFGKVDNTIVSVPGMIQKAMNREGAFDTVVNPGIAIVRFDKDGFVASEDKTGLLEQGLVNPGGALRPFIYAYLRLNGYMGYIKYRLNEHTEDLSYTPCDNISLDGSKTFVSNTGSLMMNLTRDDIYRISWRQALAVGFDIPFQQAFHDILQEDPTHWTRFQQFLGTFGIELRNQQGTVLDKPTPLAALGRDTFVPFNTLGFAYSVMANPEGYFDAEKDAELIGELRNVREVLLDDISTRYPGVLRKETDIRGVFPTRDEIGHDPLSLTILNGTTSLRVHDKNILWIGTNTGPDSTGVMIIPENGQYTVVISRSLGGDQRGVFARPYLSNMVAQMTKAAGVANLGFPMVTAQMATADLSEETI